MNTAIDLAPVTGALMQLFAAAIMGVGTWAVTRLVQWLGLKNAAQATAAFDDVLQKAVTYGLQQTQSLISRNGWDHIEVRNQALAHAAPYLIQRFPDTLRAVGVDLSDSAGTAAAVTGALDRAFPHAAARAAASPATPPATAPNPPTTQELPDQPGAASVRVDEAQA